LITAAPTVYILISRLTHTTAVMESAACFLSANATAA
jgi:hypothetical protein